MVKVQGCSGLVNVCSLLAVEEENGEGVSDAAALSVALQRERRRNAELMERIAVLEGHVKAFDRHPKYSRCSHTPGMPQRCFKKFKRLDANCSTTHQTLSEIGISHSDIRSPHTNGCNARSAHCICNNDADNHNDKENKAPGSVLQLDHEAYNNSESQALRLKSSSCSGGRRDNALFGNINAADVSQGKELEEYNRKEIVVEDARELPEVLQYQNHCRNLVLGKKSPKVAFSPTEVRRIIESDTLLQKNAQSHTIRKIIVFSSLGTKHGCEDMLELDFSHFRVVKRDNDGTGEPEEHVLYENPGVRKKIFYHNKENPTLCPVKILEEEKSMRPSDESSPSCLFLCIKYGGRTRNLPQNEYVRQQMGRNKLMSFGPMVCEIAKLVHIRSGNFFFKALGITLLFMTLFSEDQVLKETNYRSLDLLQKYYRRDAETEGHELFLKHRAASNTPSLLETHMSISEKASKRVKGKLHVNRDKCGKSYKGKLLPPHPTSAAHSSQFSLLGYTSLMQQQQHAPSPHSQAENMQLSASSPTPNAATHYNQAPYPTGFMPMIYWPPPIAYPIYSYPHGFPIPNPTKNYLASPHSYPYDRDTTKSSKASVKTQRHPEKCGSQSNSN